LGAIKAFKDPAWRFGFPIFQSRMSGEESRMQERAMGRDERMHEKFGCNGSDRCLGFHYGGEIRERYRERYIPLPRSSVIGKKVMNSEEDTPPPQKCQVPTHLN